MKAILKLTVIYSGVGGKNMHAYLDFNATISIPAIPKNGDVIKFGIAHENKLEDLKVAEIRWVSRSDQSNVLEPVIQLEMLDLQFPFGGGVLMAQRKQWIIAELTTPQSDNRIRFSLVERT